MTATPDPDAAVQDARVLLGALLADGWRELHVVSGGCDIFIALTNGRANSMRRRAVSAPPLHGEAGSRMLVAPHIATLGAVAAEHTRVAKGGWLAMVKVLNREISLVAPVECVVEGCEAAVGDLLEFDQPILLFRSLD